MCESDKQCSLTLNRNFIIDTHKWVHLTVLLMIGLQKNSKFQSFNNNQTNLRASEQELELT